MPVSIEVTQLTNRVQDVFRALIGVRPNIVDVPSDAAWVLLSADISIALRKFQSVSLILVSPSTEFAVALDALTHDKRFALRGDRLLLIVHQGKISDSAIDSRDILHLTESDVGALATNANRATSEQRIQAFRRFVLRRMTRHAAVPYDAHRPAIGRMFFDRKLELAQLASPGRMKVILGPRRIGKTTLAQKYWDELKDDDTRYTSVDGHRVLPLAMVDCQDKSDPDAVWTDVYDQIGMLQSDKAQGRLHALTDPTKRKYRKVSPYESLLSLTENKYTKPTIILDEVDHLVGTRAAQPSLFFQQVRGLAQATDGQVVLIGFARLFRFLQSDDFSLKGVCDRTIISPFSREDARRLIIEPLAELDLLLDSDCADLLTRSCGGIPGPIHRVCRILATADRREARIDRSIVTQAIRESGILPEMLRGFDEVATPEARLCLLMLLRDHSGTLQEECQTLSEAYDEGFFCATDRVADLIANVSINPDEVAQSLTGVLRASKVFQPSRRVAARGLEELMLSGIVASENQTCDRYKFTHCSFITQLLQPMRRRRHAMELEEALSELAALDGDNRP